MECNRYNVFTNKGKFVACVSAYDPNQAIKLAGLPRRAAYAVKSDQIANLYPFVHYRAWKPRRRKVRHSGKLD